MKYGTILSSKILFILLSQFVAIPEKAFHIGFYEEKQLLILHSYFYEKYTANTKKSDICR